MGGYNELHGDCRGIGDSYIVQVVSGLCRYWEFLAGRNWCPAGYGITEDVRRNLTNVTNGFVFCNRVPIKIYFG